MNTESLHRQIERLFLCCGSEGRALRKQETTPPTLSTFFGSHPCSSSLKHPLSHHSLLTLGGRFRQVVACFNKSN